MLTRFLVVFALGIAGVTLAFIAVFGCWYVSAVVLLVLAPAVLPWGIHLGTGRRKPTDPDPVDENLTRAKTARFYVRDKARHAGGRG